MRFVFALPIILSACADETISGFVDQSETYALAELNGEPFEARATIRFPERGRAAGDGPCNSWSADVTVPYPWIEFGAIAATRRACPDLQAEGVFFEGLGQVTLAEVSGGVLILTGDDIQMIFEAE